MDHMMLLPHEMQLILSLRSRQCQHTQSVGESSASSLSPSSTGSGSGNIWQPTSDDGLNIRASYTGGLAEELERLFISEPRARLGSTSGMSADSALSSHSSGSAPQAIDDEFQKNGYTQELDYWDRIIEQKTAPRPARPTRAEELLARSSFLLTQNDTMLTMQEKMAKESLLLLLSRRTQLKPAANNRKKGHCVFCKNNGESELVFSSHTLKDAQSRVTCPVLRYYTCPNCGANGDNAHTLKYCPLSTTEPINIKALKTARNAAGRRRFNLL